MDSLRRRCPLLPCLFLLLFIISCTHKNNRVTKSYYYWRSGTQLTETETGFLQKQGINKLYIKLMDIDWSNVHHAYPSTSNTTEAINNRLKDSVPVNIVPVIFITNKVFLKIDSADIPSLALRIVRRCLPAYDSMDKDYEQRSYHVVSYVPTEIQFDCDWTAATSKKYFYFLRAFNELLPNDSIKLSATIRLHQFKYPTKTGIPPVDRGMLMVYNISDPTKYSPINSIFDPVKASSYFTTEKKYALPLDIALPAYSWCIVFRNKEFYQIENGLTIDELKQSNFLQPLSGNFFRVTKDTVFRDLFLRPGDEIKAETVDTRLLQQAALLASRAINNNDFSVALFELSESEIKNYSYETIEGIYSGYR